MKFPQILSRIHLVLMQLMMVTKEKVTRYRLQRPATYDNPFQVVTDFETENANEMGQNAPIPIIEELEDQCLKPDIITADAGYVSGKNILDAEEQDVVLLGPLTTGRSSDNDKLSLADFHMDIEDRIFECPQGAPCYIFF